jgi:hypothetical protein
MTGISVTCSGNVLGIEFHFSSEAVPMRCRKLGRWKVVPYAQVIHDIDDREGETIHAVEVYLEFADSEMFSFPKHGCLDFFKASCF